MIEYKYIFQQDAQEFIEQDWEHIKKINEFIVIYNEKEGAIMSCYNVCKYCQQNDNDFCMAFNKSVDYLFDTSECRYFEEKGEQNVKM